MEKHVFYKDEDILVSSTRISMPDKIIAMHSVSSIVHCYKRLFEKL